MSLDQPVTPPPDQQGYSQQPGYPQQPGQPGFPPPAGYQQSGEYPPPDGYPPAAPGYPAPSMPPAEVRGFSGLAIAGFILAFLIPIVGFILSLIAIFQTGAGKRRGRGLAVAGVIIPVVIVVGVVGAVLAFSKTTIADPACASGKDAVINNSQSDLTPTSVQAIITGLDAAAAKAKNDDVKAAMTTASADYSTLLKAMKSGNPPAGLEDKLTADLNAIDDLCTIGS